MRFRLPIGRGLFFLSAFIFCLIALLPLRVAADWLGLGARGVAAREAKGSIWLGALIEAQFGTVPLGDLGAQLRTLPLLAGRARIDLSREEEPLRGAVTLFRKGFGIDDFTGRIATGSLLAPLPVGSIEATNFTAHFANGQCARAEGALKASLGGNLGGLDLPAAFNGTARCQGGALLLALAGPSGMEKLDIFLFEDGRWRTSFAIRAVSPAAAARLQAGGFRLVGNAYTIEGAGRF